MSTSYAGAGGSAATANAELVARLERIPVTRRLLLIRIIIGSATFFDAYTVLVIAFAMPSLVEEWSLTPAWVGLILSAGYLGQLIGAVLFGWVAEKIGRLPTLLITIVLFVSMDVACLFAWSGASMLIFRFFQGIGTGGEVPVASRLHQRVHRRQEARPVLPALRAHLPGRPAVRRTRRLLPRPALRLARPVHRRPRPRRADDPACGSSCPSPRAGSPPRAASPRPTRSSPCWSAKPSRKASRCPSRSSARSTPGPPRNPTGARLFRGLYLKRTLMIWALWITVYVVNNGLVTWLPTLYRQVFKLPLETSLLYGWITSAVGVVASLLCALYIDKVGRKRWYTIAFLLATVPLVVLTALGATTATQVVILAPIAYAILQTIAFSLYLYSAELYPTRLRAIGTGFGSAWLRAGSSIGPVMVGFIVAGVGIRYVFLAFAVIALIGGLVTARFGIETKGKVLEELSP